MLLELLDIEKSFDGTPVLRDISLTVDVGEIVALLGPSGSGKTTLLRVVAGLEKADAGRLLLDGRDLNRLPVHERGFGFVFQDFALFPHKNVAENVAFGLRMLRWPRQRIAERVEQVLTLVGLAGFGQRSIHQLSGGEQQRVALARSLSPAPRLLLLDEPLGSLDRALRERLMEELRTILKEAGHMVGRPEGITAVYVTHDQAEAFAVADRILVMNAGRIEQADTPLNLYRKPATAFVARFLGMENVFDGQMLSVQANLVRTALGDLKVAKPACKVSPGEPVTILIRPGAGRMLAPGQDSENVLRARLQNVSFRGRYLLATLAILRQDQQAAIEDSATILKLEFESDVRLPQVGSDLNLAVNPDQITVLASC